MRHILSFLIVLACLPVCARAADLDVHVRTARGAPVSDAIVTVEPEARTPAPLRFTQPLAMAQRGLQFDPFVLVVPVGAEVRFPNEDPVRHQVYSFSPTKTFELKLYGKDQTRTVRFDKAGVVSLGCNIHDQMVAFIKVTDAPFAVKTDASGHAVLHGLPVGRATIRVWHPYMKSPNGEQKLDLAIPRTGSIAQSFTAELRTPAMRMPGY